MEMGGEILKNLQSEPPYYSLPMSKQAEFQIITCKKTVLTSKVLIKLARK